MSFLKAEWRNLIMINYKIDPSLLSEYIPFGTELDFWKGNCYVSLIGFMFENTRLLGIKIPFHTNFEEVNLRFYVKRFDNGIWKRGVVFIKEIVPKSALTWVANTIYNENYETLPMSHQWTSDDDSISVTYKWKKANFWSKIEVVAELIPSEIEVGSHSEFITEHYWGYAKVSKNITNEYEVIHPKWKTHTLLQYHLDVDFDSVYGAKFGFLKGQKPDSVILAEGSEVSVESKKKIK
jgi:hypothetical protein